MLLPDIVVDGVVSKNAVNGVTELEVADTVELFENVAVTVNVYEVPIVRPVNVADVVLDVSDCVVVAGEETTVYPDSTYVLSPCGAVQETVTDVAPTVAFVVWSTTAGLREMADVEEE